MIIVGQLIDAGFVAAALFFPGKIIQRKTDVQGHFPQELAHLCIKGSGIIGVERQISNNFSPLAQGERPNRKKTRFAHKLPPGRKPGVSCGVV